MTTIEKKLASDQYFKNNVLEALNLFSGKDYNEAKEMLEAINLILKKNCVFDLDDCRSQINTYIEDLRDNVKD